MLILQRKAGQALQIGEDITVSVVSIENNRVRLSISAPSNISILRSELIAAKLANQDAAVEESAPEALFSLLDPKKEGTRPTSPSVPPHTETGACEKNS